MLIKAVPSALFVDNFYVCALRLHCPLPTQFSDSLVAVFLIFLRWSNFVNLGSVRRKFCAVSKPRFSLIQHSLPCRVVPFDVMLRTRCFSFCFMWGIGDWAECCSLV
jgi:hypothetical protein